MKPLATVRHSRVSN